MDTTTPAAATPFANREDYIRSIEAAGLTYTKQSGFLKVEAATGRRLYVAATNSVRRVDVSGWEHGLGTLTKVPKDGPFGQVKQQMVVGSGAAEDIARFDTLLAHMLTLPAVEKEAKAPKAPKAPKAKGGAAVVSAPAPKDPAKRLKEIENVKVFAEKRGTPVSPKLLAEEADLLALLTIPSSPMAEASES